MVLCVVQQTISSKQGLFFNLRDFFLFEWLLSLKEKQALQENYTDKLTAKVQTGKQANKKASTTRKQNKGKLYNSIDSPAASFQLNMIWSTARSWNLGLINTQLATYNLTLSHKNSQLFSTTSKHLAFLSFQRVQIIARKATFHISLPLGWLVGDFQNEKWYWIDLESA